ncbi:MAG: helix-turn-helix domain-containing protein [Symbiobacteriia bacterium]
MYVPDPVVAAAIGARWKGILEGFANWSPGESPEAKSQADALFSGQLDQLADDASEVLWPLGQGDDIHPHAFSAYMRLVDAYEESKANPANAYEIAAAALEHFSEAFLGGSTTVPKLSRVEVAAPKKENAAQPTAEPQKLTPPPPAKQHEGGKTDARLPTYLTQKEVCDRLQIGRTTLYRMRKQGLPAIRINRELRFDPAAVARWMEAR